MKFTLGWLKDHLETTASLETVAKALTALGLEVERVEDRAAVYAPFRVAYVEKAEKHPDADRLKVCIVDTGTEKLQVVCGAPNARAGMKGIFAPVGSHIPGTGIDLKKGNIRGQESCGMLVSEREMGLSDAHEGIIEVPGDAPLGTPFAALYGLDDPLIEINLTPNRADCAGVRGIARDLAAAGLGTLKPLDETPVSAENLDSPVSVSLKFKKTDAAACPLFVGRMIRGVKNGSSPEWLQQRLKSIGLRPISALVDITNYISHDLCRPLHVFDTAKIRGGLHVRLAKKGETLEALNDKTYELDDFMTVVCDDSGVLALGGVMGGKDSGCTDSTTDVLLECAYFDPHRTARTGRATQIISDARYRFERGIDPAFTIPAAEIATRMILELCGGQASMPVIAGGVPSWKRVIPFDPALVQKLAGLPIAPERQKTILSALGFSVEEKDARTWGVMPPSWRGDIEGAADLVEELLRIEGYDSIPASSVKKKSSVTKNAETRNVSLARKAKIALAAAGMDECVTWSFMARENAALFRSNNDNYRELALRLSNPISADLDQMRPSLLPNLIAAGERNRVKGYPGSALFEVGPAFSSPAPDGQNLVAAGVFCHAAGSRHWAGLHESRPVDVFDAKRAATSALEACGVSEESLQTAREAPGWYHPGRSGVFRQGRTVIAFFGEIHPSCLAALDAEGSVSGFEVFLDAIPKPKNKSGHVRPLPSFSALQPVSRDFAFIVDESVAGADILQAVQAADKNMIAGAEIFDIYRGKGVEAGKKSVAVNVTLQPREQSLSEPEIEEISGRIVSGVAAKTGGVLRS